MQLHVDQRCREVFDRGEALIEGFGALHLGDELGRNGLARLVVHREAIEHFLDR